MQLSSIWRVSAGPFGHQFGRERDAGHRHDALMPAATIMVGRSWVIRRAGYIGKVFVLALLGTVREPAVRCSYAACGPVGQSLVC